MDYRDAHVTGTYERPTLSSLGSFRAETGRFFIGFFADGQGRLSCTARYGIISRMLPRMRLMSKCVMLSRWLIWNMSLRGRPRDCRHR